MGEPKAYFKNIPDIGSLFIDFIIFEYQYPVFFICTDSNKEYYICLCCDIREEQRWIISKTDIDTIIGVLTDKITLLDSFRKSKDDINFIVTWSYKDEKPNVKKVKFEDIDKEDLPLEGEYYEAEENEFNDYIHNLEKIKEENLLNKNMLTKSVKGEYRVMIYNKTGNIEYVPDRFNNDYTSSCINNDYTLSSRIERSFSNSMY